MQQMLADRMRLHFCASRFLHFEYCLATLASLTRPLSSPSPSISGACGIISRLPCPAFSRSSRERVKPDRLRDRAACSHFLFHSATRTRDENLRAETMTTVLTQNINVFEYDFALQHEWCGARLLATACRKWTALADQNHTNSRFRDRDLRRRRRTACQTTLNVSSW